MNELGRLRWGCRRGMQELDRMLLAAVDRGSLDHEDLQAFERLLELSDDVLADLLMGRVAPTDEQLTDVINKIRTAAGHQT